MLKWIKELFAPSNPPYRIYGHRWKVIYLSKGDWDFEEEFFPTLYVSNDYDKVFWMAYDLRKYWNNINDGFNYSFRADINKDSKLGNVSI